MCWLVEPKKHVFFRITLNFNNKILLVNKKIYKIYVYRLIRKYYIIVIIHFSLLLKSQDI